MKENKEILNEVFFKKSSYEDKLAKRMAQYAPIDAKKSSTSATGVISSPAYQVTDTDEVKSRLAKTFGVVFGNNNVKSMASRAIKQFPIIISDNVQPETAVMLKKLMEEQYAEYINLLISNQVIDLSAYRTGDESGNIAIQALDKISGTDFSKTRVANTAANTGKISTSDVFSNIPLYDLLRENEKTLKTGSSLMDSLLEGACIVPDQMSAEKLAKFINENNIIDDGNEDPHNKDSGGHTRTFDKGRDPTRGYPAPEKNDSGQSLNKNQTTLRQYFMDKAVDSDSLGARDRMINRDMNNDIKRGFIGVDDSGNEIYTKLSTADIVIDKRRMDQAINRSVGDMLNDPDNYEIRDKFEKATFLLQSRKIAGMEYYQYLTKRLGIPVSDDARLQLIKNFKIGDIRDYGKGGKDGDDTSREFLITADDASKIAQNERLVAPIVNTVKKAKLKDYAISAGIGIGSGGVAGLGVAAIAGTVFWPILIGVGVGASSVLIYKLIKAYKTKRLEKKIISNKIEGWERVEALIEEMTRQQAAAKSISPVTNKRLSISSGEIEPSLGYKDSVDATFKSAYDKNEDAPSFANYINAYENSKKRLALTESGTSHVYTFNEQFDDITINNMKNIIKEVADECKEDEDLYAKVLEEKILGFGTTPMQTKYIEAKPGKDVLLAPTYSARANIAYGSTEIERKDNKDRRYDQPLIMTVKFKERFSDGKYSDNELTAVIGILGKIIRVPSEEMAEVLKRNINGTTIEHLVSGDLKNVVSDMLSSSKISKDVKALPQSADIWRNLEKITTLAAANSLAGKRNNNLANAHIIFSQKEIDEVRNDTGVDYLRDIKKTAALMKRYSAFTLMIANDPGQRLAIFDDQDAISWNMVPYTAIAGKDGGDQLNAFLNKMARS